MAGGSRRRHTSPGRSLLGSASWCLTSVPSAAEATAGLGLPTAGLGPDPQTLLGGPAHPGQPVILLFSSAFVGGGASKSQGQAGGDSLMSELLEKRAPRPPSTPLGLQPQNRSRNIPVEEDSCPRARAHTQTGAHTHAPCGHVQSHPGLRTVTREVPRTQLPAGRTQLGPCPRDASTERAHSHPHPHRRAPPRAPLWQRLADAALAPAREAPPRLRVRKRGRREGQETWVPLQALQLPQSPQRQDPHRPRREAAGATPGPASAPRTAPAARCRNPRAPGTVPSGRGLRIPLPARRRPGREAPGDLAPPARGIGCAQAGRGAPLGPGMRPGPRARAARP